MNHVVFVIKLFFYQQDPVIYRAKTKDEDVAQIFVEKLEEDIRKTQIKFTNEDEINFDNATKCWICSEEFGAPRLTPQRLEHSDRSLLSQKIKGN